MESTIGQRIRQLREAKQLSVAELAKAANVKPSAIYGLESDANKPSIDTVRALWAAFPDLSTEWLQFGSGKMLRALTPAPAALVAPRAGGIKPDLLLAEEPAPAYGCVAPDMVATLNQQLGEAHARIVELEAELRDERKQARIDLRSQATLYNSVKVDQQTLIDRLYAKLDEYELLLGYRKPTAAERQAQEKEQAGSGAPRVKMISFGERYRTPAAEPVACVMREMYPATDAALDKAA